MKDPWGAEIFWIAAVPSTVDGNGKCRPHRGRERLRVVTPLQWTHELPLARDGQGLVAGVGEGDGYGGIGVAGRDPPGEGHSGGPNGRCAPSDRAPTPVRARECPPPCLRPMRRCRSAAARPSRSRGCRPATSSCPASPDAKGSGVGAGSATRRPCWPSWRTRSSRGADRLAGAGRPGRARGRRYPKRQPCCGRRHAGLAPVRPYDAILVAAASPEIPAPLVEQLGPGGRLTIPRAIAVPSADPGQRVGDEVRTAPEWVRFVSSARRIRISLSQHLLESRHGMVKQFVDLFSPPRHAFERVISRYGTGPTSFAS